MASSNRIKLEVVTPARAVLSTEADEVVLPGVLGEVGILPGHLPLLTALDEGAMVVRDGTTRRKFTVEGGFAEVSQGKVTVVTEGCQGIDEIDIELAHKLLDSTQKEIKSLEERSKTEMIEEDILDHHRKMLKRAQTQLLLGDEKSN